MSLEARVPKSHRLTGVLTCWYTEASRRLQNSKIASLKHALQKVNEHLKTQDRKYKFAKPLALQIQQLGGPRPKLTPGPSAVHPPRDPSLKYWPRGRCLSWDPGKEIVLKGPMQMFPHHLNGT